VDKLEGCSFFFLNFKRKPSQEEHKTIYSGSKIMALSDKVTSRRFPVSGRPVQVLQLTIWSWQTAESYRTGHSQ
jgi:hypothetical protein